MSSIYLAQTPFLTRELSISKCIITSSANTYRLETSIYNTSPCTSRSLIQARSICIEAWSHNFSTPEIEGEYYRRQRSMRQYAEYADTSRRIEYVIRNTTD